MPCPPARAQANPAPSPGPCWAAPALRARPLTFSPGPGSSAACPSPSGASQTGADPPSPSRSPWGRAAQSSQSGIPHLPSALQTRLQGVAHPAPATPLALGSHHAHPGSSWPLTSSRTRESARRAQRRGVVRGSRRTAQGAGGPLASSGPGERAQEPGHTGAGRGWKGLEGAGRGRPPLQLWALEPGSRAWVPLCCSALCLRQGRAAGLSAAPGCGLWSPAVLGGGGACTPQPGTGRCSPSRASIRTQVGDPFPTPLAAPNLCYHHPARPRDSGPHSLA